MEVVSLNLLNIGCGGRHHPDWVNVDLTPTEPGIVKCDIRNGLSFGSEEFNVVYNSHVLEHLERENACRFLKECFRVLKPKGVVRIAVPDLERIVRGYLTWLDAAANGQPGAEACYDWILLELYDQAVRTKSGGGMLAYLQSNRARDLCFVRERCGNEIAELAMAPSSRSPEKRSWLRRIRRLNATRLRDLAFGTLLGEEYELLRFFRSGELHRWMYDQFSLRRLLIEIGFEGIRVVSAAESRIPMWISYELDSDSDGRPRKPDSLYVEAIRP
jgi:SAM-dependent methyltransferase